MAQIVWDIRLPRTLGACLPRARCWAWPGAVAQGLFRNPLADPFLLGSASGASLGVALALAWAGHAGSPHLPREWLVRLGLTGAAFVGAVLAVLLTLAAGARRAAHAAPAAGRRGGGRGAGRADARWCSVLARHAAGHAGLHAGLHRLRRLDRLPV
jgi:ABC-type Fe3+-siderophore transport system permease subunit